MIRLRCCSRNCHSGKMLDKPETLPPQGRDLRGHYVSFKIGDDPSNAVDRFELRQTHGGSRATCYRNGPPGTTTLVDVGTASAMESYDVCEDSLSSAETGVSAKITQRMMEAT